MSKRLVSLITILGATAITASAVSFGYFYFGGHDTGDKKAVQDLRTDSIYENYESIMNEGGDTSFTDTSYDIYVFPSPEYMKIYDDYLSENVASGATHKNLLPEDFNGYIEPIINDDGTLKIVNNKAQYSKPKGKNCEPFNNDPNSLIHEGKTFKTDYYVQRIEEMHNAVATTDQYEVVDTNLSGTFGDWDSFKQIKSNYISIPNSCLSIVKSHNYYEKPMRHEPGNGYTHWCRSWEHDFYKNPYTGLEYIGNAAYQKNIYDIYDYHARNTPDKIYRPYGHPDDPIIGNINDPVYKNMLHKEKGLGKNLFSAERYGCWKDLSLEEGRFKPIKITVKNSISPQLFELIVGEITNSLNDGNRKHEPYFETEFAGLTYVDVKDPKNPIFPLDHIANNLQSVNSNLAFGKGKRTVSRDYLSSADVANLFDVTQNLSNYADENNVIRLFPTFSSGKGYYANSLKGSKNDQTIRNLGGRDAIRAHITQSNIYPNSLVEPTKMTYFTSIKPAGGNDPTYNSMPISALTISGVPINVFTSKTKMYIEADLGRGGPASWFGTWYDFIELDFSKPEIMNKLNGPGYYNMYLFVGRDGYGYNNSNNPLIDEYITGRKYDASFPTLRSKRLWHVGSGYLEHDIHETSNTAEKPFYLAFQKATQPKIYEDISPDATIDQINSTINKEHDYANTAFQLTTPVYAKINSSDQNFTRVYTYNDNGVENVDNIFLFKNVDFTDVSYDLFQIRFGNTYNASVKPHYPNTYNEIYLTPEAYNGQNDLQIKQNGIRFHPAITDDVTKTGDFFRIVEKDGQFFMELKDQTCRGIYDIVMAITKNPQNNNTQFDIYVYRYTNIFVKIFDKKITDTIVKDVPGTKDKIEFLDHTNPKDSKKLFEKRYFIGDILRPEDIYAPKDGGDGSFLKDIISNYILNEGRTRNINFNNFVIRDQVTDASAIWFVKKKNLGELTGEQLYDPNNFTMYFNESFNIRKNYVFYIDQQVKLNLP